MASSNNRTLPFIFFRKARRMEVESKERPQNQPLLPIDGAPSGPPPNIQSLRATLWRCISGHLVARGPAKNNNSVKSAWNPYFLGATEDGLRQVFCSRLVPEASTYDCLPVIGEPNQ